MSRVSQSSRFQPAVTRRALMRAATALAPLAWLPHAVDAQAGAWPSRPLRLVVNFPPGSSPDVLARALVEPMGRALGQSVVVDNRSGASGMIGADLVAKAEPDGHVLLLTAGSTITTNPFIYPRIPYDTDKDLVPVAAVARIALFLVCRPDLPVRDVGEFIAYLKAHPDRLSYGSAGNGTGLHLAGELFKRDGGVQALHVPFRGASPALQGLLAGQIDFMFDPGIAMSHVRAGRLRMLAVAVSQRSAAFPQVPTLDEAGLAGFDAGTTHGVYAPAGVPAQIVARVHHEVNRALASERVRAQIAAIGAEPSPLSVAQFAAQMARDSERYGAIVRERNIRVD